MANIVVNNEIASDIFKLLSVDELNNKISMIFLSERPVERDENDVEIIVTESPESYKDWGKVEINFYTQQIQSGQPDTKAFQEISKIIQRLVHYKQINRVILKVVDETVPLKSIDNDVMYLISIKVRFKNLK